MMKAEETGVKIMELVEKNITARQIITDGSSATPSRPASP